MTTEQYTFLQTMESHLLRALESNYCRYIPQRDMMHIADILKEHNPSGHTNIVCPKCKLSVLKEVARLYLAEREVRIKKAKKNGNKTKKNVQRTKPQDSTSDERGGSGDE